PRRIFRHSRPLDVRERGSVQLSENIENTSGRRANTADRSHGRFVPSPSCSVYPGCYRHMMKTRESNQFLIREINPLMIDFDPLQEYKSFLKILDRADF